MMSPCQPNDQTAADLTDCAVQQHRCGHTFGTIRQLARHYEEIMRIDFRGTRELEAIKKQVHNVSVNRVKHGGAEDGGVSGL